MIGIAIYSLLSNSVGLTDLVDSKIYPYAIDEEVLLPAVVYRINSIVPQYNKDEAFQDVSTVELVCFSDNYKQCLLISNQARLSLESYKGVVDNITIVSSRIENISEGYDFDLNTYYSKILLTIKTNR